MDAHGWASKEEDGVLLVSQRAFNDGLRAWSHLCSLSLILHAY